jgi:uncharacterized membrane protein YeaQ/YmgE (transglycosylase-associated protein family)
MGIILWVIFGGFAGWVASIIMGTNSSQDLFLNVAVGVLGAVIGGWFMSYMGGTGITGFNLYSFLIAVIGSVVLLTFVRLIKSS